MKLLIAGSRTIPEEKLRILNEIPFDGRSIRVISGQARGADRLGENWAASKDIPIEYFPADWKTYGKSAGHIRNKEMGQYCDVAIIILDSDLMDKSKGTWGMMKILENLNKNYLLILHRNSDGLVKYHLSSTYCKPLTKLLEGY